MTTPNLPPLPKRQLRLKRYTGYSSQEWLELRDNIVGRDGHRCRNCGTHETLEVHHWLPIAEFQDRVDHLGYATTDHPLIVEQSGLVTLCKECHRALTSIRTQNAVLKNPRLKQLGRGAEEKLFNVFQLWALNGERLPFKVKKASWSDKVEQYYLVERIEISRWPYGFAWGSYFRDGKVSETDKIRTAGTYCWRVFSGAASARNHHQITDGSKSHRLRTS
jgi:5-methylcytosine-specific restriction endonuclease McrA